MAMRAAPLDVSTWDAFAALVEANNGIFGGCWCVGNHVEWHRTATTTAADNRELKHRLVIEGRARAALVFAEDSDHTGDPAHAGAGGDPAHAGAGGDPAHAGAGGDPARAGAGGDRAAALGWCQYGTPEELRIKHRVQYEKDPPPRADWRISCIFVDRAHRGQGVARAAVAGALKQISAAGGGRVEAISEVTAGRTAQGRFLFSATVELFESLGFTRVRQVGKHAWIVTADIE